MKNLQGALPSIKLLEFIFTTILIFAVPLSIAQDNQPGRSQFDTTCARCHGGDAKGGESGPSIISFVATLSNADLAASIRTGNPVNGMPAFNLDATQLDPIISYLRFLVESSDLTESITIREVLLDSGELVVGEVLNSGLSDLQLRTAENEIYLLRKSPNNTWRRVSSQHDWPTFHGIAEGNRYSTLTDINKDNINRLAPAWSFPLNGGQQVQNTPLVLDGLMYISSANEVYALDAGTGREIWHYRRPRTQGLPGPASLGINRGVALKDDKVFLQTDNVHIIALNRFDGTLLWDTPMADIQDNYQGTSAPLIAGDLVISGVGGGDLGARGFVAAYDASTGAEVWRRWTIPAPGEPGSETWLGDALEHGAGGTWMTGTYDSDLGLIYWPVGNPGPDFNGDERLGDNLYSDSILALNDKTGELEWYYQFVPHDIHDWDAQEPPVLIDTNWRGEDRQLLIQANRNGFFYVIDRTDGELLLAEPFIEKLNWASGIDDNGRPVLLDLPVTESGETYVCPSLRGGANWYSTSYNPITGLYYVPTLEQCNLYTKTEQQWQSGSDYMAGTTRQVPGEKPRKIIRALDIQTGEIMLDIEQAEALTDSYSGLISTAAGIVFYGDIGGEFVAADALSGEILWQYSTNQAWKASPMTYLFDNELYIATAVGLTITAFKVLK